jgi:ABC-2 type transport system ATP-binding protein
MPYENRHPFLRFRVSIRRGFPESTPSNVATLQDVGSPARTAVNPAIRIEGLTKRFGSVVAVEDLSLTVAPGEVFGFLGPNGAGKSTTIRLLLGLIRPTAGSAEIFGCAADDVRRAHCLLAYVPADVALWPGLTGAEILELLGSVGPGVDAAYREELVDRFDLELDKRARTYSTGNRQKVALVAAFATRAPLLVLDEPTSGLDPLMEREFRACVAQARERGQTVFLSSHQLAEVEAVCDRVAILRAGRLAEVDSIADLRRLRRTVVEVSYRGDRPSLEQVDGVSNVENLHGERLRFNLTGSPAAALGALAKADISALAMHEPTLEEIFLDYYGDAAP